MIETKNLRQSYKFYRKNTTDAIADMNLYLKIITGFVKFIMKKVFEAYDVDLSSGSTLGTLGIRGKKARAFINKEGVIS